MQDAPPQPPPQPPITQGWQQQGSRWTLSLGGDWRGAAALALEHPPQALGGAAVRIDAEQLTGWDTGLAAALRDRLAPLARAGVELELGSLPAEVRAVLLLALPEPGAARVPVAQPLPWWSLEGWGERVLASARQARLTAAFLGEVLLAMARVLRGSSGLRRGELWRQIDQTGPLSIGIVALTCFLVGLMLAYMGGAQLDLLGAQAFIADIVTVAMVREVAPLMTGVILAGRVGSAFAAQLATMNAGEEIDALRVLGVDPIDHLVLPRILALVMVAPAVMAYGAAVGVLAGAIPAAAVYGVQVTEYLYRVVEALSVDHLGIGLFKCTLYAALLGLAGCREGLHAGRDAQAVGQATTGAVVKALVWIIAAACTSTVFLQLVGF